MQDLERTCTSNAIEGNILTAAETTLVVEKGITIGGKPLKDHLEAVDHFEALHYVRELARRTTMITELDARTGWCCRTRLPRSPGAKPIKAVSC